jgi:hypothetical protein
MLARAFVFAFTIALLGASPAPSNVAAPSVPLHAVYTVETNKLGQVVRVVSAQATRDEHFNTVTRGNAMQAFIRRPNGTAVAGVYKLTYDYSPSTKDVRRDVQLVHAGGVDPNAKGAVIVELEKSKPAISHLPDFSHIISPEPSASDK